MSKFLAYNKIVPHSGALATNILSKVTLTMSELNDPTLMHPYVVKEGDRPDLIASSYYGSPEYAWLIYLANNITDPYYQWPVSQEDFNDFLKLKYGSTAAAQEKILYYAVNWDKDDSTLTVGAYDSLPGRLKKYWAAQFDVFGRISSYVRSDLEVAVETNRVVELEYTISSGALVVGDKIKQVVSGEIIASGFVKYFGSGVAAIDKIDGTFDIDEPVINYDGTLSATISTATIIVNAFAAEEEIYWAPVTAFDYEDALNESRKTINIIDKRFVGSIEDKIKSLLA